MPLAGHVIDYDIDLPDSTWQPWSAKVATTELETHFISRPDVVVPTTDTARHEEILYSLLAQHKTLLLCGPPGSGM